jgi:hypothetical protein
MISETDRFKRLMAIVLFAMSSSCASKEPRVERIDGSQVVQLPLKFESMSGMRDGESVTAAPLFANGGESVRMTLRIRLGPPITFVSGEYRADVGGQTSEGRVVCDSLSFLGGQNALPSVGGIFRLQDANGHTVYRVSLPPTPITRRSN